MLLRLKIRGFKNLRDVDIRFGPLTCFVGSNAVGKSNVFDAIQLLRNLADHEIQAAAEAVRSPAAGHFGPLELFWNADPNGRISIQADMLVPDMTTDDFGRRAAPTATLLRYRIEFTYEAQPRPRLELAHEELTYLKKGDAKGIIGFEVGQPFFASTVKSKRKGRHFLSTVDEDGKLRVVLHQDGGSRGRPVPAGASPRSILGGTGGIEYPTVLAARREMASWRAIHLEPSSLRQPDEFGADASVDDHGAHIAATLIKLRRLDAEPGQTEAEVANRLAGLVPEVRHVRVREDEVRQQYVVEIQMRDSPPWLGPRALSDGTLRFLALIAMQMDAESSRVLCMEEPENGIHPSRTAVMVELLRDYVVDPSMPVDEENPLRQVILNTHSPDVLRQLRVPEVLFVESVTGPDGRSAVVRSVDHETNWRDPGGAVSIEVLEALLGGAPAIPELRGQLNLTFGAPE